jgi:phosphoserine phosphatase
MQKRQTVLAVDLDHTLIDTDLIYLGLKQIIYKKIYLLPYIFYLRFFRGKPYTKEYLYQKTDFDVHNLPFNNDTIQYIKNEKDNYDHIILISGSYYKYVKAVYDHLKIFDSYAGTDHNVNMISFNKVKYLNNKFNNPIYDYIGDNIKDLPIWELSRKILVVDHGNIIKKISHLKYKVISKKY